MLNVNYKSQTIFSSGSIIYHWYMAYLEINGSKAKGIVGW